MCGGGGSLGGALLDPGGFFNKKHGNTLTQSVFNPLGIGAAETDPAGLRESLTPKIPKAPEQQSFAQGVSTQSLGKKSQQSTADSEVIKRTSAFRRRGAGPTLKRGTLLTGTSGVTDTQLTLGKTMLGA